MTHRPEQSASPGRSRFKQPARSIAIWLAAALAATAAVVVVSTPSQAADPLRSLAAARGKFIGYAANAALLCNNSSTCTSGSDATYRNLAATEFNQVTHENALKWEATEPSDNNYTFTQADGVIAFAAANNQVVHGHTLVWHSQTPGWVQGLSATAMRTAMQEHITTVVGRYANNPIVQSWDVVNEAFNEDGTRRGSFWQNTLGDGYIADAFRYARAADPDATLCINDYNVESANAKSNALFNLVSSLKSQGVPIDCVGLQSHLGIQYGAPSGIQAQIQRFAGLGVSVRITELDIRMIGPSDSTKLATQAQHFTQVVNACNAVTACAGITMWGIDDGHSWIPETFPDQCCGLLWNASYEQKPAYTAVATALGGGTGDTQAPTTPGTPTSSGVTTTAATLSWTASTDNVGVTGYDIYRAPGASGGTFASVGTATTTTFTNTGLTAATTYRYQVRARDAAGNTSAFTPAITVTTQTGGGDTQAPTTPGTPTSSGITTTAATLSWTASTDNVGVTGYDIYRAPGASGGTFASVGTATTTTFTNTGLTAATTYRYQVRARDAAGNTSAFTPAITVTTQTGGGTGGCSASYTQIGGNWPGGFQGEVRVTNTGTTATTAWSVVVTFANGQRITQIWSGRTTSTASPYTVTNESYNGALGANAFTTFGFLGSWTGSNTAPTLTCTRTP